LPPFVRVDALADLHVSRMRLAPLLASFALALVAPACGPSSARVNDARTAYFQTSYATATAAARAAFADFGVDDASSDDELVVSKPRPYTDGGASALRDRDASRTRGYYDSLWWVVLRAVIRPAGDADGAPFQIEVTARVVHAYNRSNQRYEENVEPPDWVDEIVSDKQIAIADRLQQQRVAPPAD
jgi:hypothetical protein